jgi:hypothetical protein
LKYILPIILFSVVACKSKDASQAKVSNPLPVTKSPDVVVIDAAIKMNTPNGVETATPYRCSGLLIGPHTVLTASHCISDASTWQFVRASVAGHDAKRYIPNPLFKTTYPLFDIANPLFEKFDVALIVFAADLASIWKIKTFRSLHRGSPAPQQRVFVAGWGATQAGNVLSTPDDAPNYGENQVAGDSGNGVIHIVGAGSGSAPGKDSSALLGDSGGPMVDAATLEPVGVVSTGRPGTGGMFENLFADLSSPYSRTFFEQAFKCDDGKTPCPERFAENSTLTFDPIDTVAKLAISAARFSWGLDQFVPNLFPGQDAVTFGTEMRKALRIDELKAGGRLSRSDYNYLISACARNAQAYPNLVYMPGFRALQRYVYDIYDELKPQN